jgi:predicted DNA-binding protein
MAKFRREKSEARARMLSFRASASEAEFLKVLAESRGVSLAELLREALDEYVERHRPKERKADG